MAVKYLLCVIGERASDIPRSRNFAEDLHFSLAEKGLGTTSDPDTMTTELYVVIPKARKVGQANQLIRDLIAKHMMEHDTEITRV